MGHEKGRDDGPEASRLSRRKYLLTAGTLASGVVTGAAGEVSAATSTAVDVTTVSANSRWRSVDVPTTHTDPVVVVPTLSYNGTNPASPRIRNVRSDGFGIRTEEWRYLDGDHYPESIGCFVSDTGTDSLSNGSAVELGRVRSDHRWTSVSFDAAFDFVPLVFSNTQTINGAQPVVTRTRNLTRAGMEIRLQEEENEGPHLTEDVGYLAVEPGTGTIDGRAFEAGSLAEGGHEWQTVSFVESFDQPIVLADLQTYRGTNTATVRYRNLTASSVEVKIEEERSADREMIHLSEVIGYLVLEGNVETDVGYGDGGYGTDGFGT